MTFDAAGNVYVTDAHQGIIWSVGGVASAWVSSALLKPTRISPTIGANGLAFKNKRTDFRYVAAMLLTGPERC